MRDSTKRGEDRTPKEGSGTPSQAHLLAHTAHLNALLHNLEEGVLLLDSSHHIVYANPAGVSLFQPPDRELPGAALSTILQGGTEDPLLTALNGLAARVELATERLDYACGESTFRVTITKLLGQDGDPMSLVLIRDISQSLRRIEELKALKELSTLLTSTLDVNEILRRIMARTHNLMGVEASSLLLKDEQKDELVFRVVVGEYSAAVIGRRLRPGQGIAGWVMQHGLPQIVPDVRQDSRFFQGVDYDTGFTTKSLVCVPLRLREKVIGVIQVLNGPADRVFTQDDVNLLSTIAAHAATAIDNARVFQKS